jgi:SMI1 / KNR4 family (SUKH-1)
MQPDLRDRATTFAKQDRGVLVAPLESALLEERLGALPFMPPPAFNEWLAFSNGCCLTHGGVYGLKPPSPSRDIAEPLAFYPTWAERRWLPVAWDGFGNEYALDCHPASRTNGEVWFFETTSSTEEPASRVASSLPDFLAFFFSPEARSGSQPPGAQGSEA